MTRHEALKALLAQPDPQDLPQRRHLQIYPTADYRKLDMTWKGPLAVLTQRWMRRYAA